MIDYCLGSVTMKYDSYWNKKKLYSTSTFYGIAIPRRNGICIPPLMEYIPWVTVHWNHLKCWNRNRQGRIIIFLVYSMNQTCHELFSSYLSCNGFSFSRINNVLSNSQIYFICTRFEKCKIVVSLHYLLLNDVLSFFLPIQHL